MDTTHQLYQFIKTTVEARKSFKIWSQDQVERYVDDNFYAYSRGNFVVALTNSVNEIQRSVTYHPFSEGETVCNIYYSTDCVTIKNGVLAVTLLNGEPKIYVAKSSMTSFLE